MSKILYTAEAQVTGGRMKGHGRSTDGALDVEIGPPAELGGEAGRTNPEQLFAVGYAACFESAVQTVARRRKVDPGEVSIASRVHLLPTEKRAFKLAVGLDVTLPGIDDADEAVEIVRTAHRVCPYSMATRDNIDVELSANGRDVE
jgi:lipoyl-dependent peroxiredoxin